MDISTPNSLSMDPFSKTLQGQSPATAFEFDFELFNNDDDILSSLTTYNKSQQQVKEESEFACLTDLASSSLPDSPESWISNSSNSDDDCEVEICEITPAPLKQQKKRDNVVPTRQGFKPATMDPYLGAQTMMMPNMMLPQTMMMTPQQLMFLQQGFPPLTPLIQHPMFVPVPTPTPTKQPVTTTATAQKTSHAATNNKRAPAPKAAATPSPPPPAPKAATKKRRNSSPPSEEQEQPQEDDNSSPVSSPSSSPTPDSNKPTKDKDFKRQRRLIKNRESAQASRERKKIYVQGLEKKVDDLSMTNTVLTNKVLSLEEENILLRERLLSMGCGDASVAGDVTLMNRADQDACAEPTLKKRRTKIPVPANQAPIIPSAPVMANNSTSEQQNPFTNGFWNAFASFSPPQQSQSGATWTGSSRKRVVLFVMLFCVAVFVMYPKQVGEDTSASEMDDDNDIQSYRISRTLKEFKNEENKFEGVKMIMEEFLRLNETCEGSMTQDDLMNVDIVPEGIVDKVTFSFDKNGKDIVLRIPVGSKNVEKVIESDALNKFLAVAGDVKIKKEPGLDAVVGTSKESNSYTREMERLSEKMLFEVCKAIGVTKE
ncbi:basic-leucine zipper transcription factor F [Acrasis kona]|uniref:Basic-leucine zipper transcription factor F n=1 Tax=Acrasis kona TaxID=1008807 RepID=A0AAW2ZIM9_9EUKA